MFKGLVLNPWDVNVYRTASLEAQTYDNHILYQILPLLQHYSTNPSTSSFGPGGLSSRLDELKLTTCPTAHDSLCFRPERDFRFELATTTTAAAALLRRMLAVIIFALTTTTPPPPPPPAAAAAPPAAAAAAATATTTTAAAPTTTTTTTTTAAAATTTTTTTATPATSTATSVATATITTSTTNYYQVLYRHFLLLLITVAPDDLLLPSARCSRHLHSPWLHFAHVSFLKPHCNNQAARPKHPSPPPTSLACMHGIP